RAVMALDIGDLAVADLVFDLAADAAIGADAVDGLVGGAAAMAGLQVDDGFRHQRASRAGLDAFAAGDAGGVAHRIVEIEHDLLVEAAPGHADDVVDLHLAAGADAEIAIDAGVEIDRHRRVREIRRRPMGRGGEAGGIDVL